MFRYVTHKYGAAVITSDEYNDDPTTKDATHLRRTGDCVGVTVHVVCGMMICVGARLALSIANFAIGATNFSLAKLF